MDRKKISLLSGRVSILYHQHLEARRGKGRWERGIRDTFLSHLKGVILLFVYYSLDIYIPNKSICQDIMYRKTVITTINLLTSFNILLVICTHIVIQL